MRTRPRLVALAIGLALAKAAPVQSQDVELRAAWGGAAVQGTFTEIEVVLRSAEAGQLTLVFPGGGGATRVDLDAPAAEPVRFKIPLPVAGPGAIPWEIERDGRVVVHGSAEVLQRVARHPWDMDVTRTAKGPRTIALLSSALPDWTQAYSGLRSLTMGVSDLQSLTERQALALEGYLARCGRLVLIDAPADLIDRMRELAGCGGRHITAEAGPVLQPELPSTGDLAQLSDCVDCGGALRQVTAVVGAYVLLFGAAGLFGWHRGAVALGIATTLVLVTWYRATPPFVTWLSWSQSEADSPLQVRRTVLLVDGRGTTELALPLPMSAVAELPLPAGTTLHYTQGQGRTGSATLRLQPGFLSRVTLSFVDAGPEEDRPLEAPSNDAGSLAAQLDRRTGLSRDLGAWRASVEHPSEGLARGWHATIGAGGG